jgi:Flp pilus assembly protein TadG
MHRKADMKIRLLPKPRRSEKGQSLVELAFTVVLLMIMIAGIVDIGRIFFHYITMRDSAMEGIAYGSIESSQCAQIVERIRSSLNDPYTMTITILMNGESCSTASATSDACTGNDIEITVTDEEFPITMPFLGTFLGKQSVSLETTVHGTILRPACR